MSTWDEWNTPIGSVMMFERKETLPPFLRGDQRHWTAEEVAADEARKAQKATLLSRLRTKQLELW